MCVNIGCGNTALIGERKRKKGRTNEETYDGGTRCSLIHAAQAVIVGRNQYSVFNTVLYVILLSSLEIPREILREIPRKTHAMPTGDEKRNILFILTWPNGLELILQ